MYTNVCKHHICELKAHNLFCELKILKVTVMLCHPAQDVLPLPIPETKQKGECHCLYCLYGLRSMPLFYCMFAKRYVCNLECLCRKKREVIAVGKPEHPAEGGLSPSDEVAVAGDDKVGFFLIVLWILLGLPAGGLYTVIHTG